MSARARAASTRQRGTSEVRLARSLSDAIAQHDVSLFDAVMRRFAQLGMLEELAAARSQKAAVFGDDDGGGDAASGGTGEAAPGECGGAAPLGGESSAARESDLEPAPAPEDAAEDDVMGPLPGKSVSNLAGFLGGGGGSGGTSKSNLGAFLSAPSAPPVTKLGSFMSATPATPAPALPSLSMSVTSVPAEGDGPAKPARKGRRRSSVLERMASGDAETRAISIAKLTGRDRTASHIGTCCCALLFRAFAQLTAAGLPQTRTHTPASPPLLCVRTITQTLTRSSALRTRP